MTHTITMTPAEIRRALIACSSDSARRNLSQIQIEPGGRIVATDGARLHLLDSDLEVDEPITIPRRLLDLALQASEADNPITIEIGEERAWCDVDDVRIRMRHDRHTRPFPPYQTILDHIPASRGGWSVTSTEARRALRDLGLSSVQLTPDGPVRPRQCNGAPRVNAGFLDDALRGVAKDHRVTLSWAKPLDPIEFEAPGIRAIVMPIRGE